MWKNGTDLETIRILLGQSSIESTKNYLGVDREDALEVNGKFVIQLEMNNWNVIYKYYKWSSVKNSPVFKATFVDYGSHREVQGFIQVTNV